MSSFFLLGYERIIGIVFLNHNQVIVFK